MNKTLTFTATEYTCKYNDFVFVIQLDPLSDKWPVAVCSKKTGSVYLGVYETAQHAIDAVKSYIFTIEETNSYVN